jgi:chemotaxis protein MotB
MSDENPHEIIIVRKRHGHEDEDHHGGVWKLAFADFMTAMMAFFLVMWLINSTSKETKATIVQYFNPVQLVDSNSAHKGLRDPKDAGQGKSAQQSSADQKTPPAGSNSKEKADPVHEAALLYDPMVTLDEIAGAQSSSDSSAVPTPSHDAPKFGDPFDRVDRGRKPNSEREEEGSTVGEKSSPSERAEDPASSSRNMDQSEPPVAISKSTPQQPRTVALTSEEKVKVEAKSVTALRREVEKILKMEGGDLKSVPHIEVTDTSEGMLINLTDDANFSMFAVGSVEPKPQLVRILGRIGRILSERSEEIELRGHTDGRSYKSATYDNWRLSSDRANMAYYMLIRGGLAEKRVIKIAGYADRRLKTPKDPMAANNRRIEILIRRGDH